MIKTILYPLFLLLFPSFLIAQQTDAYLNKAGTGLQGLHNEKNITGLAAGYSIDGNIIWSGKAGWADEKSNIPFSLNTLNRIASIAKPMTAVAIMQLNEKELVDLDAPITNYLPDYPQKEKGTITVRHLLAHTSGTPQYQSTKEVENTKHYSSLADAANIFQDRALLFTPGNDFFYTTYGYVLLGQIIEEVTGLSYGEYMRENIWLPAGMQHTSIEQANRTYENKSKLYHRKKKKAKLVDANDLSDRIPGGGIQSTLEDVLKFGWAVLDKKLISIKSLEEMTRIQFEGKEGNPYGLGWFLYGPPPNENLVIGHSGEQTGSACQLMLIPKSKTAVAVISNTSGAWKDIVMYASELIQISESSH